MGGSQVDPPAQKVAPRSGAANNDQSRATTLDGENDTRSGSQVDPHPAMRPEKLRDVADVLDALAEPYGFSPPLPKASWLRAWADEMDSAGECDRCEMPFTSADDVARHKVVGCEEDWLVARVAVVRPTRHQLEQCVTKALFHSTRLQTYEERGAAIADDLLAEFWPGTPEETQ